jgi:hypothetical protein
LESAIMGPERPVRAQRSATAGCPARTTLQPPLPRGDLVDRPHLVDALRRGVAEHPLSSTDDKQYVAPVARRARRGR